MIIISKHTNQLCNRLFTYLPVISYALEANERVAFLFQYKGYSGLFPNLAKAGYISKWEDSNINGSLKSKAFNALVRFGDHFVHLVLKPNEKIPLKKPLGVLFAPKWREIRYDHAYIEKHSDRLRWLFAPSGSVVKAVKEAIGEAKADVATVGVHIRRGDYREYKGGIYFYSMDIYANFMQQMKSLLADKGKRIRFFLCSNEPIEYDKFNGFEILRQPCTDMMIDLYTLAACDYIIGPPSTYSQWASFYGMKSLYVIRSKVEEIDLNKFKVIEILY